MTMADRLPGWHLTGTLLAPVTRDPSVPGAVKRIPETLAALAVPRPGSGALRLTDHDVRMALNPSSAPAVDTPFTWSARTARRALGLAAVRALVSGEVRSPTDGVRAALARATRVNEGQRPTTMDRWLAGLTPAARTAVTAEAVTWATRLSGALDWTAFETPPTIGRDHWWDSPHSSLLALRSRAEVRAISTDAHGQAVSVHLVLLGGRRRPSARAELSVVALVEALRTRDPLGPGRVVGWWPDSGHLVSVGVDRCTLEAGVAAVARTLGAEGPAPATPVPHQGGIRAAA
jgi:hypothetical protein